MIESGYLSDIVKKQKNGIAAGIVSVCTANSYAIKSAMQQARKYSVPVLIEATANQVDQRGGYTGMTPADFVSFVRGLAAEVDFPLEQIIFGGDHLGPLTRKNWNEDEAMAYAEILVREYVLSGFTKIHLDTSMRLGSDAPDKPLPVSVIAGRGARLCRAAEKAFSELRAENPEAEPPLYVIGSEVPIPGGTQSSDDAAEVTSVEHCSETYEAYSQIFENEGLSDALKRVIALVVQTGAEFGDNDIYQYNSAASRNLIEYGRQNFPFVFEGHSTDYQTEDALREMVRDGIAFLKVGPALTFAFREALFSLELIEKELHFGATWAASNFREVLELAMLNNPANWQNHYHGDAASQGFARKFSFSDRARYYFNEPAVEKAISSLIRNINNIRIPLSLISQYMPLELDELMKNKKDFKAEDLIYAHIGFCLESYYKAVLPEMMKYKGER